VAGRDAGRWDWQLAVRAGLGKGPDDTDNPPQVKIIDSTAMDGKGRIDATFPLGAKFWVQLVVVDPSEPNKYEPLQANSHFKLNQGHVKPEVPDALFPNNVVIEYAADKAENFKHFQAVHLGTVTLTIKPKDYSTLPVKVFITVNRPESLGTTYNNWDDKIVTLAHQRGIPPQFIKGQMRQESDPHDLFNPRAYRYEPLSGGVGDMYLYGPRPTGRNWRKQSPYEDYRLAVNDAVPDRNSAPWPAPAPTPVPGASPAPSPTPTPPPTPVLSQGTDIQEEDIEPRSRFLMCKKGLISEGPAADTCAGAKQATVPMPASEGQFQFVSAREIIDLNDDVQNWLNDDVQNWAAVAFRYNEETRNKLASDWGLLNFTAQTPLAASYGLLQILYSTALHPMGWKGEGGHVNPSLLFDTDSRIDAGTSSLPLGVGYLASRFLAKNRGVSQFQNVDEFTLAFRRAFGAYNNTGADDDYAKNVVAYAGTYPPVPTGSVFPGR
jgi:hypothetical protein